MSQVSYAVHHDRALWNGRTLRAWVNDLVAAIAETFDPELVILFGSVAAGTDGPDSDIDLLIVLREAQPADRRALMVALRKTTREVAAPHDLLVTSIADYERNRTCPGTAEYGPAQFGTAVYERFT